MTAVAERIRALPQRYGRRTLLVLAAIALLGLAVRAYVVVNPVANPGDDSHAYYALSKSLYAEGSFGGPEFEDSSDWSPGAPFLYAAAFAVTGGAREGTARIVAALLGVATILVVFALGWRLGGRWAALIAAFAVAVYPPFIHTSGELMSEPPAMLTLPAAILAFLWASERTHLGETRTEGEETRRHRIWSRLWPWLIAGLLFGLTAMFRPEYLLVAGGFVILALVRVGWRQRRSGAGRNWGGGLATAGALLLAIVLPILPWTIRNAVVLDRLVPISTGGGKALYVGTFLPADGDYQRVKATLVKRYRHEDLAPDSEALNRIDPMPLFNRVAARYPDLSRDSALGKIGKQNLRKFFGEDPTGYLAMTARKVGRMWSGGVGEAMSSTLGNIVQVLLVLGGLAGLAVLAIRKRWWEVVVLATPIALITVVGAVSLAATRRNEVLMTLIFPLAGLALASGLTAVFSSANDPDSRHLPS